MRWWQRHNEERRFHPRLNIGFAGLLVAVALTTFLLAGTSVWLTSYSSRIASV